MKQINWQELASTKYAPGFWLNLPTVNQQFTSYDIFHEKHEKGGIMLRSEDGSSICLQEIHQYGWKMDTTENKPVQTYSLGIKHLDQIVPMQYTRAELQQYCDAENKQLNDS